MPARLLLTGSVGASKTTVAAGCCGQQGVPYAAIDLAWLAWCFLGNDANAGDRSATKSSPETSRPRAENYRRFGVRRLVPAGATVSQDQAIEHAVIDNQEPFPQAAARRVLALIGCDHSLTTARQH